MESLNKMKKRIVNPTSMVSSNRLGTMLKVNTKGPSYTYPETNVAPPQIIPDIFLEENQREEGHSRLVSYQTLKAH